ncbi:MAG: molybdopterin-guanine dinucleotide biosynthesis protein B [Candidatus Lindowbacteria bacterium]|nr:molybdopterin-guanine dinucleotide biosynthesis protein B [Candidatus Lindowbacteria bacterium]
MHLKKNRCNSPVVFGIYGPSGSGKTTWTSNLVQKLSADGLSVSVVKRCHHDPDIEPKRKDSAKYLESGAEHVLLLSDNKVAVLSKPKCADATREIENFISEIEADVVLIEGDRNGPWLKICVGLTDRLWNIPEPFPVIAHVGNLKISSTCFDWTHIEVAAVGIKKMIAQRTARFIDSGISHSDRNETENERREVCESRLG